MSDNPEGLKLKRSFSSVERKVIEEALEIVKEQAKSYTDRGSFLKLSPFTFYAGIVNLCLTCFVLGKFPEHYWLYQTAKCIFYLSVAFHIKAKQRQLFFLLDFCWVAAFVQLLWLMVCVGAAFGIESLKPYSSSELAFKVFWGYSNGTLGSAAVFLGNALVLHDAEQLSSTFIHLTPMALTWSLRWYKARHDELWPGVFGIPTEDAKFSFMELYAPPVCGYFVWWTCYTLWWLISGRNLGWPHHEQDTVYMFTARGNLKFFEKSLGFKMNDHRAVMPFLKYMFMHMVLNLFAISLSYFQMTNFWIHTALMMAASNIVAYNGSTKYFKMMTSYYKKKMEKLVAEKSKKKKDS